MKLEGFKIILLLLVSNVVYANGYDTLKFARISGQWKNMIFHVSSQSGYIPITANVKKAGYAYIGDQAKLHDLPYNITSTDILEHIAYVIDIKTGRKLSLDEMVFCNIGDSCIYKKNEQSIYEWPIKLDNYPLDVESFLITTKDSMSSNSTLLIIKGNISSLISLNLKSVEKYLPYKDGGVNGKEYRNLAAFDIGNDKEPDIVIARLSHEYTYFYVLVRDNKEWKIAWQSSLD